MKAFKVLGFVALLISLLFGALNVIHGSKKPEFVDAQVFKEKCGYEMPLREDMVVVKPIDTKYLKLDMGTTRVVTTGYQKEHGEIYLKVVNPLFMPLKPLLEITCQRAGPHETGN